MSTAASQVRVALDIGGQSLSVGTAYISERRGTVSTVFDYDAGYLADRRGYALSPDLALHTARHHVAGLPGAFADCAPDRWGRNLIAKRLAAQARGDGHPAPSVREIDYLLGVSDLTRQGALRFALTGQGPYLAPDTRVPKLVELPRLLHAADTLAADGADDLAAVKELLDAGSGSLGGARPKASVRDAQHLLIAKFPHPGDEWDVMAWEKTALDLAADCGIRVPARQLLDIAGRHVLLLERFDRTENQRVGYISAMTLLGLHDGDRADYLEIAEAITAHGGNVTNDLEELWRRIAFSLVINNTDDHLRNHGFLHGPGGWRLSPAFDLNPNPDPAAGRVTSIGFVTDAEEGMRALLASARDFGLTDEQAQAALAEVLTGTAAWRETAAANGLSEAEGDRFAATLDRFHSRQR